MTPNLSLPVVAAHHPRNIRKLTFVSRLVGLDAAQREPESPADRPRVGGDSTVLHSSAIQDLLIDAAAKKASLMEALEFTTRMGKRIQSNLQVKLAARSNVSPTHGVGDRKPSITFWTPKGIDSDFQVLFLPNEHICFTADCI
jgi:hypothetical protein